jgi:hypothetical protein
VLADDITPPGVAAKLAAAKLERRVETERDPARLVTPVLEEGRSGAEEFLTEGWIEALQPGKEHARVAPRAGDRHGIELQIAEALDDSVGSVPGPLPMPLRAAWEPGPLGLQEAGAGQRQSAALADGQSLHWGIITSGLSSRCLWCNELSYGSSGPWVLALGREPDGSDPLLLAARYARRSRDAKPVLQGVAALTLPGAS